MKVIVNPWIKQFIEKFPNISRGSACGWLIGFQSSSDQTVVLSAIAASQYSETDGNFRLPDTQELDELSSIIPSALKVVGMFHFKPGSQLKVTGSSGIPANYYNPYHDKLICVTNIETTKWYTMDDMHYTEQDVYYHDIPENIVKFLLVFVKVNFATEINLKLKFLPQITNDVLDSVDSSIEKAQVTLRNSPLATKLQDPNHPFFNKEQVRNLLDSESILKEFDSLKTLIDSNFSSITTPDTYLSLDLSIDKISNPDTIKELETFTKHMGAYGKMIIPCVLLLNLQHPQNSEEITKTLKLQLHNELKIKLDHALIKFSHNRKGLLILPPESVLMQYKNLILNIKTHLKKVDIVKKQFELEIVENLLFLSYFSQNNLPEIAESFFAEEDKLIRYRKKFSTLARIGDKNLGIGLLRGLGHIYKERGQIESIQEVQRLVSGL